jgi:peptide/nickel transport system permease protein
MPSLLEASPARPSQRPTFREPEPGSTPPTSSSSSPCASPRTRPIPVALVRPVHAPPGADRAQGHDWLVGRFGRPATAWLSWLWLALVAAAALCPQALAPFSPTDMRVDQILRAPGWGHLFGTDQFGRDVLSLVIYGARQSMLIGLFSVGVGGGLGILFGLGAGYLGRGVDAVVMRLIDIWMAIPSTLLAIIVATALGPSLFHTILAIGVVSIPRYTRVVRGQVLSVRRRPFVDAARSVGTSHLGILVRHIAPHCASPVLVLLTLGVGHAILMGSALSFLGLGVVEERPDWGYLLTEGRSYLTVAWWISTFPGLAVTALLVAINVLGDRLRGRMNPRDRAA